LTHCPKDYIHSWKDTSHPDWKDLPENDLPDLMDTNGLSRKQLLQLYKDFLADRTLLDIQSQPVFLGSDKAAKFFDAKKYSTADLRGRFKYLNCIDNSLESPTEVWIDQNKTRIRYMKKFSQNVMIIVDIDNGQLNYFNLIISDDSYMNRQRKGYLTWF
jgi:hypothetical protein